MATIFKKKDNKQSVTKIAMTLKKQLKLQFDAKESELRHIFGRGIYENILCEEYKNQITIDVLKKAIEKLKKTFIIHDVEGDAKPHLVLNIKTYRDQLLEFDIFFDFADTAMHVANNTVEFFAILEKDITQGMSAEEQSNARDKGMLNFILTREETEYTFFYMPGERMAKAENNNENGGVN